MSQSWLPKQKIVVPIDFSDDSLEAIKMVREEFVAEPSALHAVYVLPVLEAHEPAVLWGNIDDKTRAEHAEKVLREKLGPHYEGINVHVGFGDPGSQIVEYAKKIHAELIVMPSHGRTGFDWVLLGSVADRVVRHAPCPVLVLRKS